MSTPLAADSDDEEAETLAIVRKARAAVPPRRPPPRRAPAAGRGAGLDVCAPCAPVPCVYPAAAIAALERRLGHAV